MHHRGCHMRATTTGISSASPLPYMSFESRGSCRNITLQLQHHETEDMEKGRNQLNAAISTTVENKP